MPGHSEISRRRVVTGAAWAAPAIVIATAAPVIAATNQGQPNVTALVEPTSDTDNTLPVTVRFSNSGTGSTGLLVVDVIFTTNVAALNGTLSFAEPTLNGASVAAGWEFTEATGSVQRRILTFTNAMGIAGTTNPLSPTQSVLAFSITVVPGETSGQSAGDISVFFARIDGPRPNNGEGVWL